MRTIYKANKNLLSILGKQKFNKNNSYRLLNFVVTVPGDDDSLVIYNNMTKSAYVLNKDDKQAFIAKDFSKSCIKKLLREYYFVPKNFDEVKTFVEIREIYKTIKEAKETNDEFKNYTILPTSDCNARCFYCFENGCEKTTMDKKRANEVADFIIKKTKSKKTTIGWFGGEPLIAIDLIDLISKKLKKSGFEISSSMISNGYLFDENVVKKAKDLWELKSVQITLDGTEEIYNKVKSYRNLDPNDDRSPFIRVLDNIELLVNNGLNVSVRLNLSPENEGDIEKLIKQLAIRFKDIKDKKGKHKNNLLNVYTHTLFQELAKEGVPRARSDKSLRDCYKRELQLQKLIFKQGLKGEQQLPRFIRFNYCMADSNTSVVIFPKGQLGLCEHFDKDIPSWGTIYSDNYDTDTIADWKIKYKPTKECQKCAYFPTCLRLKNCPNTTKDCQPEVKEWRNKELKNQLKYVYQNWKS